MPALPTQTDGLNSTGATFAPAPGSRSGQSRIACHTTADGQTPKGPLLVDSGPCDEPDELVEPILKPSTKLTPGNESYGFVTGPTRRPDREPSVRKVNTDDRPLVPPALPFVRCALSPLPPR